jgi:ABC-2 type transport system permease protein
VNKAGLNNNKKVGFFGKIKASFSGRKFRGRMYITVVTAVVFVIILVINMLVSQLNIQVDLSSQKMYTLTEDTKELVSGVSDDLTIYYLVQSGYEQELFKKVVERYDGLSDKITLEYKDPVLYPTFAKEYTEEEISENSFIVVNNTNGRVKYIDYNDMLVQEMDYNTYSTTTTGVDVEGELSSAIQFVTSAELPVMYVVEGHGETTIGSGFEEAVDKMNVTIEKLKTMSATSIPEDCGILYLNAPTTDFTPEETAMIKSYLADGGKMLATVNYKTTGLENYVSILEYYGIEVVNGIVFEGSLDMLYSNNPMYLLPKVESNEITTRAADSNVPVIMPQSVAVKVSDTTRSSLSVSPLLTTSEASYAKNPESITTAEKKSGDVEGPFHVGIAATDRYNETETKLVVFTTEFAFDDNTLSYANLELLSGTVGYLAGESVSALSIPTKSVEAEYIYPSQAQALAWGGMITIIIPAAILAFGIVVSLRRRKK